MAHYCYEGSRKQINNEQYYRNIPSSDLQMTFSPRPVETRHQLLPMVDCREPSKYAIIQKPPYCASKTFAPSSKAPYSGYKADDESSLLNIFFPLQAAAQSKYIPGSRSDLYHYTVEGNKNPPREHSDLFRQDRFLPKNADPCNLSNLKFYNHTKYQVKNL